MSEGIVAPQDLDAEHSVLGAVLLSGDGGKVVRALAEEQLRPEDFYREQHARIYLAMLAMLGDGEPIDTLTLRDRLKREGALEQVGGKAAIDVLSAGVPAVANYRQYARIVIRKSMWRARLHAVYSALGPCERESEGEWRAVMGTMRATELWFRPLLERGEADR